MTKIFYGDEEERDFSHPDKYAFLNWWMDDGMGTQQRPSKVQKVFDNYYMGRAYLVNALLSLYTLISKNHYGTADVLVFPIMFDIWHGTEVWLKSGCSALEQIYNEDFIKKQNHDIYSYYSLLEGYLDSKNLLKVKETALCDLDILINEFKRVNAKFDFARYSFDVKDKYQFYNAPYSDPNQWQSDKGENLIVPNTCLDLGATFELILNMVESFGQFIKCLTILVVSGDELSNQAYMEYIDYERKSDELFDTHISKDMWEELLDIIKA
ncbi:MAG: hypothetical protein E7274_01270 [Pseudobutyrivibrio ruminis]|uniref:hypothetical protein n=1 Tax=Pseudobutyrivibrio ruminis TaxID=46206 RepID=UPI0026EDDD11|nr:hypothetical protein [Pseudobutyrivibrio ruminis]MBE5912675.1 hypothetical protein [Pseudobutyrivibrio ruminis]